MKFNDLSIQEKAAVIKLGVGGGLHTLLDIALFWDSMPDDPPVILKINKSQADFVLRLKDPNRAYIRDWENPDNIATHKLSWADNGVVYPLVLNVNGRLVDFSRPPYNTWAGYDNAVRNGDTIHMTPLEAEWFTTHYKDYYPGFDEYKKGGSIHIKPENRGKFTALKKRTGHSATWFKEHGTPTLKKMATFALNARKWHHKHPDGGPIKLFNGMHYIDNGNKPYIMGSNASMNLLPWIPSIDPITNLLNSKPNTFYFDNNNTLHRESGNIIIPKVQKSKDEIIDFFWKMENPNNYGLNDKNGMYYKYRDPNGKDWDVGPGLVIGSAILEKPYYTKEELDQASYDYYINSINKISQLYDTKYGNNLFNNVSDDSKLAISDVMYRAGLNGVTPESWPKFFDAIYNQDTIGMLNESRTKFTDKGKLNYDNARVQRLGEYLYPNIFEYKYKNSLDPNLKIKKKSYGGPIKPFSYLPIPEVRY